MSDAAPVLQLLDAFRASKVMFTAVALGVFDLLPASAADLASATSNHPDALARLLDACTALGLLVRDGEVYRNLPVASQYLRRDSPDTLTGYILYSDRILYPLWGNLAQAVREGTHRWEQTFGGRSGIFENLFADDQAKVTFLQGMHGMGLVSSPAVVAAFDLSRFTHLCDLGGATGHLAIEACRRYTSLRATVFDLPPVIPQAQRFIDQSSLAGRLAVHPGDFFTDPLPDADLYSLGRIVHDWSEPKIHALLAKIHQALPAGGGLLIAERILYPFKDGPLSGNLQSLNMLVVTEGKERNAQEYEALLHEAGFTRFQARSTGRPLDAMLAIK
jgi:acetylserotonin O-methyltransferase